MNKNEFIITEKLGREYKNKIVANKFKFLESPLLFCKID